MNTLQWLRQRLARLPDRFRARLNTSSQGRFFRDIWRLICEYKWYSLAIFAITILQEFAAIWPVNLLGDFIDQLETPDLGNIVWMFFAASLLYPALARANVVLRHKMFYETDFEKRVELVIEASDCGKWAGSEKAGAAYTRAMNAVSGITNTTYHLLGSFTPVLIKIVIVAGNLLGYNRTLGWSYLATLIVPTLMTIWFNKKLMVLRDSQYSVVGEADGTAIEAIQHKENPTLRARFQEIMRSRANILIELIAKHQMYLYFRQAALIGSQFLIVFLALAIREQANITPGAFSKIIGYTTQVAAAFVLAAAQLDAIISYSRAYHVYATAK